MENVLYALENNVYPAPIEWNAVDMSIKSIYSIMWFTYNIFLFIFCPDDLSNADISVLKFSTIIIFLLISP